MNKEDILRILKAQNGYVSGEVISKKLDISRMAVSKNISQLRSDGYEIDARTNRGYKLIGGEKRYDYTEIASSLPEDITVMFFDELTSTNAYLKTIANSDLKSKTCVVSKIQTAGRGRRGNSFSSQSGIYASILIRPKVKYDDLACLTAFAGVCVCEAINEVCGVSSQIKWVNDIILEGKKICGILTEISLEAESAYADYAIIGVGINTDKQSFPDDIKSIAISIEEITGNEVDKSRLLCEILTRISSLETELTLMHDEYLKKYKQLCLTLDKRIKVMDNPPYLGYALDISEDCSLIVKSDDGHINKVNFGDVSVRGLFDYT